MTALNRYYLDDISSRIGIKCVFISHQRKDKDVARAIAHYIEKAGIDVYFDEYDSSINIYDPYSVVTAIKKGICKSTHMLCILSNNAMESKWMPWEIGYGYDRTQLYGLTVKELAESTLPEYLQIVPILRGTKSLNEFLERVCDKPSWQMLNENLYVRNSVSNHPLDSFLNWKL